MTNEEGRLNLDRSWRRIPCHLGEAETNERRDLRGSVAGDASTERQLRREKGSSRSSVEGARRAGRRNLSERRENI